MTSALDAFKHELMMRRVAARFVEAIEFDSPEALAKYLKDHPNADKSLHSVKKKKDEKGEGHGEGSHGGEGDHGHDKGHGGGGLKGLVKRLSKKAVEFVKSAPEAVQKFCTDKEYREVTLFKAAKSIEEAPEKFLKSAWGAIKHEAKEFKTAAVGMDKWVQGQPLSDHDKHAIKHVALHAALTVAVTALTGGAGAALAANFSKAVAKKVALNAVTSGLGDLVMAEEVAHLAHGIGHHAGEFKEMAQHAWEVVKDVVTAEEKGKKKDTKDLDPRALMTAFVTKAVNKEVSKLKDEDLEAAIEEAAGEGKKDKG